MSKHMDSKRILVLVNAYGLACHKAGEMAGRDKAVGEARQLWEHICRATGNDPDCLVGLCDDDLDPDRLFGGPQGQDTD